MAKHTPTPWEQSKIGGLTIYARPNNVKKHVAIVSTSPESSANAAYIVKAVNNHEALVKALEEQREWLAGRSTSAMLQGFPIDDDAQDRIEHITRVLAGVVGGSGK